MASKVTPYKDSKKSKKEQVTTMFDTISGSYDDLNRVISLEKMPKIACILSMPVEPFSQPYSSQKRGARILVG